MDKLLTNNQHKKGTGQQLLSGPKLNVKQPIHESMAIVAVRMVEILNRANETYLSVLAARTQHKRKLRGSQDSPPPWDIAEEVARDHRNYVEACTREFVEFFSAPILKSHSRPPRGPHKKR